MTAIAAWGTNGNAGFALPMEQATPDLPAVQAYVLAWDPALQLIAYVPVSIDATSGDITPLGNVNIPALKVLKVGGTQVVGARKTGWAVMTGTPLRTTFDTATVTLPQLAGVVMALQQDLFSTTGHGLIGA